MISRYSFTSLKDWRLSGRYWRREDERLYAPLLERTGDGSFRILETPGEPGTGALLGPSIPGSGTKARRPSPGGAG